MKYVYIFIYVHNIHTHIMKSPNTPLKLSKSSYTCTVPYIYTHMHNIYLHLYFQCSERNQTPTFKLIYELNLDEWLFPHYTHP